MRRNAAELFADFRAEVRTEMSRQIDSAVDKHVEAFKGKVRERLSVVEERATSMSSQVQR